MNRILNLAFILVFSFSASFGQRLKKADRLTVDQLRAHITYLSNDQLEGRRAGTNGEKLAMEYISREFQKAGLKAAGSSNNWYQPFDIYDGKQVNPSTHLFINGADLKLNQEYFPLSFSGNKSVESAAAMALPEKGVPWFYNVAELLEENKQNPHYDLNEAIRLKATAMAEKGAAAMFVYNSSELPDNLSFNGKAKMETSSIPVLYISRDAMKKYISEESSMLDIKLKVDIGAKNRTGHNVIGYHDNGASSTIIFGAHYDHLGYGEDGNSMIRSGEKSIHNGADDNASGTAALIELARLLNLSKNKQHNYLFIAFSGEELGLFGSKYFTENPTIDLASVNYMINMDMIGRLDDKKSLTIGGYGTSPVWGELLPSLKEAKSFSIKFDSSGTGPSDHTSFYRKDKPVLFFFTGLHSDYHKPTDDADKINYNGQLNILKYITELVTKSGSKGKIAFMKTREQQTSTNARFSVSLGIMPDYTFTGSGVRVDGVSAGRAAEKVGIKEGDVIVQLGDHAVNSMETYMQALASFKKGDKSKVKYKRGNEELQADVEF